MAAARVVCRCVAEARHAELGASYRASGISDSACSKSAKPLPLWLSRSVYAVPLVKFDTLSIVIPVYNEARTIHQILDLLRELELVNDIGKEIILVNDCSTDASADTIRAYAARYPELGLRLLEHAVNQGKGAALHTGIREATGDYVIIQDADLEYDPEEYNLLLKPVLQRLCRRGVRLALHGRQPAPHPVFLAQHRQPAAHVPVQHVHRPEPDRHGNLLQAVPARHHSGPEAGGKALRLRARGDGQSSPRARTCASTK